MGKPTSAAPLWAFYGPQPPLPLQTFVQESSQISVVLAEKTETNDNTLTEPSSSSLSPSCDKESEVKVIF